LEKVAGRVHRTLRIFLGSSEPIQSLQRQLRRGGDGEVSCVVLLDNGQREVEVKLPGNYQLSPQLSGALKTLPGVMDVQMS
ncbi:hypothetical protein, partial [Pseudovibrio sp. POLY-S9]